MDPAYASAFAALAGSVIGGLTFLTASWLTQRTQVRAQQVGHDVATRENLYKDFIEEASALYGDALEHDQADKSKLVSLYALVSRMRVRSSPAVIENADTIMQVFINTYTGPNITLRPRRTPRSVPKPTRRRLWFTSRRVRRSLNAIPLKAMRTVWHCHLHAQRKRMWMLHFSLCTGCHPLMAVASKDSPKKRQDL